MKSLLIGAVISCGRIEREVLWIAVETDD